MVGSLRRVSLILHSGPLDMPVNIAVAKEIDPSEPRVAASPDTAKKFKALGAEVVVEPGAGIESGLPDRDNTMMLLGDAKKVTENIVKAM